ncbi:S8 family serine peptidase [Streptomyces sp. NPDC097619]|uniref:S8 family peptidase n=1 Tax=Streptomyces sp. NPDC097619 TaxID=3157228 RepID=UPI0033165B37
MGRTSKAGTVALAAAVVGALVAGTAPAGAQDGRSPGSQGGKGSASRAAGGVDGKGVVRGKAARSTVVTLVTGDEVVLGGDGKVVRIDRAAGREGIVFTVRREAGRTYVIPQDAQRPLADGVVDRRLFDVTRLVADGYDDARRSTLPLIVGYRKDARSRESFAAFRGVLDRTARERRTLSAVDGEAFTAPKGGTAALWAAVAGPVGAGTGARTGAASAAGGAIAHLWLDGRVKAALDKSVPQIGAPSMWQAGYTGKGVKVAVLDTGIDQTHPDLKGLEIAEKNFSDSADGKDRHGHGTHVASTIAGSGAKSGGRYKGVAPDVRLIDGKVLSDDGWGTDSDIVGGMEWAVEQGAKIVSMSIGGGDDAGVDPKEEAVARLSAKALFVIAAGNNGSEPGRGTIASPGSSPAALTVGAVDKQDRLAEFSSRGPTAAGVAKPDITAPGVDIMAAQSTQGHVPPGSTGYVSMSGTSMATPHVAGAAALLLQQHPDWSGARVKALLTGASKAVSALNPYQQGAGRVDLTRARTATVVSEPALVDFGTQLWPHADDTPVVKTLTYRNLGKRSVKLRLSVAGTDPAGRPAPAGTFVLADPQLTVPAGGTARTTVTVDTRKGTLDGTLGGTVTAYGTDQSVRTPLVAVRESEAYDVTFRHLDETGAGAASYATAVMWPTPNGVRRVDLPLRAGGSVVHRLPKGTYLVESLVYSPGSGNRTAALVQPALKVTGKTSVTLDARVAKPLAVTAPDATAQRVSAVMGYDAPAAWVGTSWVIDGATRFATAGLGAESPGLQAQYHGLWKTPGAAGTATDYRFAFLRRGTFFTGLSRAVTRAELAEVKLAMGASVSAKGVVHATPYTEGFGVGMHPPIEASLPLSRTQYVNTAGVSWDWSAAQLNAAGEEVTGHYVPMAAYTAGKRYALTFNTGVFGPDLSGGDQGAYRYGDRLDANVSLFADGSGHEGYAQATGFSRLESGGRIIAEYDSPGYVGAEVPAASAAYRLTMEGKRPAADATIGTKVAAVWTFTSARPSGDQQVKLPLSTVRLSPALSLNGTAPAGGTLKVPLFVGGPAAAPGKVASLAVSVSFDGGTTWKALTVATDAAGARSVTVVHPAAAKTTAFRVDLKDTSGNTLRTTFSDAYRLAP